MITRRIPYVVDSADAAAELQLDVETSELFDQFPVVGGFLVECGIEVDDLQPFGTLFDPLLCAGDRVTVKNNRIVEVSAGKAYDFTIA